MNIGDPKRALFLAQAALGALAALGLERILAEKSARKVGLALLVLFTAVLLAGAGAVQFGTTPHELGEWAVPRIAASVGLALDAVRHGLPASLLATAHALLRYELVNAAVAAALATVALLWFDRARVWPQLPTGALLLALALPLALIWRNATSPIPTEGLDARPPLIDLLLRDPPRGRLIRVAPRGDTLPVLPPKLPMRYGLRDAQGYVALYLREWQELFEAIEPGSTMTVGVRPLADPQELALPLFDRLDVEVALVELPLGTKAPEIAGWSEQPIPMPPVGAPAVAPAAAPGATELHLYRNHEALGRASFVWSVTVFDDEAAVLRRLASRDYDPRFESCVTTDEVPQLLAAGFVELSAEPGAPAARRRLG